MRSIEARMASLEAKVTIYEQAIELVTVALLSGRPDALDAIGIVTKHLVMPLMAKAHPPFDEAAQGLADIVQRAKHRLEAERDVA